MEVITRTHHIDAGVIVKILSSTDTAYTTVGVIIHPASIKEGSEIKNDKELNKNYPIVRTACYYYRLSPNDRVEIIYDYKEYIKNDY